MFDVQVDDTPFPTSNPVGFIPKEPIPTKGGDPKSLSMGSVLDELALDSLCLKAFLIKKQAMAGDFLMEIPSQASRGLSNMWHRMKSHLYWKPIVIPQALAVMLAIFMVPMLAGLICTLKAILQLGHCSN